MSWARSLWSRAAARPRLVICAALLILSLSGLGSFPLHEPDEGRYATIAATMVSDGDWLTPRLSGITYYEKPPLYFWAVASSIACWGRSAAAARLPSALAFVLCGLLVAAWARRALGRRAEWVAPFVFASTPLAAFLARIVLVDTGLALLTTCCLYAAFRGLVEPEEGDPPRRGWVVLTWIAAGLAVLTKGPIGLVLPFSGLGSFLLLTRSWRRLRSLCSPTGILLFLGISLPWFVWMSCAHEGYARAFFLEQNLARATTGGRFDRDAPLWFYGPVLLAGFAPWVLLLPAVLRRVARAGLSGSLDLRARARLFWACSFAVPVLLLSCVGSKLAYYLLPLAGPFALLVSDLLCADAPSEDAPSESARPESVLWRRIAGASLIGAGVLILGLALAGLCALGAGWEGSLFEPPATGASSLSRHRALLLRLGAIRSALPLALSVGLVLGALVVAAGRYLRRGAWRGACGLLGACVLAASLAAPWVLARAEDAYSAARLVRALRPHVGSAGPVVSYGTFVRSLSFELDCPTYVWIATYSEFGHDIEPGAQEFALQASTPALQRLIGAHPRVAIVARGDLAAQYLLDTVPGQLEIAGTFGDRVLLVRSR